MQQSARKKVIIDTDPGVDDVLALLYALSSPELDVLAITTVHNAPEDTRDRIDEVVIHEDRSQQWMDLVNKDILVAAGADGPLDDDEIVEASYFHGRDGLGGASLAFPQYLPATGWEHQFPSLARSELSRPDKDRVYRPSPSIASDTILDILRQEDDHSVTIIALGPLTNLSLAARKDYTIFSKAEELVCMGGALAVPGNVTPVAEFNFLADADACAHLLSLTSPDPSSTWASSPSGKSAPHKQLKMTVMPLDTTTPILLRWSDWHQYTEKRNTPLAKWSTYFLDRTFNTMKDLYEESNPEKVALSMHDPATIFYALHGQDSGWEVDEQVDIRMETRGRWTRGMCVMDRRGRQSIEEGEEDVGSDKDSWLSPKRGNRVRWVSKTPGSKRFIDDFLPRLFGNMK